LYGNVCGELIIPKIWCYFNVKAPIYEVVLLEKSSVFHSYAGGKVELLTFTMAKKNLVFMQPMN